MKKLIKNFGAFMALCMFATLFAVCGFAYAGYNAEGDTESGDGPFTITVVFTEGGTVSRDPMQLEYAEWDRVTFYITPDEGFELVEFKVNDVDLLDEMVKDGNTYTYTFVIKGNTWVSGIFQNPDYFEVAPEYFNGALRWYEVNDDWTLVSYDDFLQFANETNFYYGSSDSNYFIMSGDAENGYYVVHDDGEAMEYYLLKLQPDGATILIDGKETLVPVMYMTNLETETQIKFLRAQDLGIKVNP